MIALIPLSFLANTELALNNILGEASWHSDSSKAVVHASFLSAKTRMCFIQCALDVMEALDAARIADLVLFVVNVGSGMHDVIDLVDLLLHIYAARLSCFLNINIIFIPLTRSTLSLIYLSSIPISIRMTVSR